MNQYLLIESADPFQSRDGGEIFRLAAELVAQGNEVVLFLVQNAVLGARSNVASVSIADAVTRGVNVVADDFSLRERGIGEARLQSNVKAVPIEWVVDRLAEGYKALWH